MKFNPWFVLLLVAMPLLVLVTGLTAAAGFGVTAMWATMACVATAGVIAARLAWRMAADAGESATSARPRQAPGVAATAASTDVPRHAERDADARPYTAQPAAAQPMQRTASVRRATPLEEVEP